MPGKNPWNRRIWRVAATLSTGFGLLWLLGFEVVPAGGFLGDPGPSVSWSDPDPAPEIFAVAWQTSRVR